MTWLSVTQVPACSCISVLFLVLVSVGQVTCVVYITFTFSHLADAFIQSDVQGREQSSYEQ